MTTVTSRRILLLCAITLLSGVPLAAQAATLSVSPTTATPNTNTTLTVSWTGSTLLNDWVGLYVVGADNYSELGYFYVSSCGTSPASRTVVASGNCPFTFNQPIGSYEFRFLPNDSYTHTATSQTVTVPDTTPPTASITSPSNGATVSSTISVTANASDNIGVVGVQFKLDGANLGAEDTASPYSVSWNTTTAVNGSHSLTAVARDAAGNTTTSSAVNVTVSNVISDTTAPTVPTGLVASGVTSSQVSLSWTASTDAVGVTGYRIYRGGVQITTVPSNAYTDTGLSPSTSYSYYVRAYDAAANVSGNSSTVSTTTTAVVTTAWTAPTSNAPNGNSTAPLHSGTTAQDKAGILGITGTTTVLGNALVSASTYFNWGTIAGSSGYGIRDLGGVLQAKSSSSGTWGNIESTVKQLISSASAWVAGPSNSINYTAGNVGIGTASPVAKLDVQGYARLTPQTAAPAACDASRKGALAVSNFGSRLCICNGTAWVFNFNGSACVWAGTSGTQSYDTRGTYQFTVPAYAGSLTVQVWGAGGGASGGNYYHNYSAGGNGGASSFAGLTSTGGTGGVAASNQGPYWMFYYPAVGGPGGAGSGGTTNLTGSAGQGDEGAGGGASPNGGGASTAGAWGNWPGGGGAGGYSGSAGGAGGGGGGGYTSRTYAPGELSIGSQITVTVGESGMGASAGCCTGGTGAHGRVHITWN